MKSVALFTIALIMSLGCDDEVTPDPVADAALGGVPADAMTPVDASPDSSLDDAAPAPDAAPPVDLYPNLPGGNPLNPSVALYPFPSDFLLADDAETATGRRLRIPAEALPEVIPAGFFDVHDGFTRTPSILATLPGGIDVATLPSPTDHAESVADDATVWLIHAETGARVGALVELDARAPNPVDQALIIRPLATLAPDTDYVVILRRGLTTPAGLPHVANPAFVALRDGVPTDVPEIERQRGSFERVNRVIEDAGLNPDEVILAWSFHTRSEVQVVSPLLRMQQIAQTAPVDVYEITQDEIQGENRQLTGTFEAPNFVDEAGRLAFDEDGVVVQQGTRTVPFRMTIPLSIESPRPVILYGHGFLGQRNQATRGSFNALCRAGQYSAVAVNFGFHEEVFRPLLTALASDITQLYKVVNETLQTFPNSTLLVRLTREVLARELTREIDGEEVALIDPERVHYLGISNGGTFGFVMAATSPQLTRAVMVVGGGGLTHFLQRAVQWNEYGAVVDGLFPDLRIQQGVFALIQQTLDPVDSMNYMGRLVHDRFPGLQPLKAQVHMAIHDSQVNNLVTEWAMRSGGIPMVVPSPKVVWELETVEAPNPEGASDDVLGAMFVYDEMVTANPVTNVPPAEDNRTHSTIREIGAYQTHVRTFLDEGRFVQVCDGPCDPE